MCKILDITQSDFIVRSEDKSVSRSAIESSVSRKETISNDGADASDDDKKSLVHEEEYNQFVPDFLETRNKDKVSASLLYRVVTKLEIRFLQNIIKK